MQARRQERPSPMQVLPVSNPIVSKPELTPSEEMERDVASKSQPWSMIIRLSAAICNQNIRYLLSLNLRHLITYFITNRRNTGNGARKTTSSRCFLTIQKLDELTSTKNFNKHNLTNISMQPHLKITRSHIRTRSLKKLRSNG